jgi:hypothetical protein
LSDAEITNQGLSGLSASALEEISMLLTAEKIVLRDPKTRAAYYTVDVDLNDNVRFSSSEDYRAAAERRISSAEAAQGLPIVIGSDGNYR